LRTARLPGACKDLADTRLSDKAITDRMFTIEQINDLHDRFGNIETFAQYARALNVSRFDIRVRMSRAGRGANF
jgi:hypothetical protein